MNWLNWVGKLLGGKKEPSSSFSYKKVAEEILNKIEGLIVSGKKVEFSIECPTFFGTEIRSTVVTTKEYRILISEHKKKRTETTTEELYQIWYTFDFDGDTFPIDKETYKKFLESIKLYEILQKAKEENEKKDRILKKLRKLK